jgi:hypothetical protein
MACLSHSASQSIRQSDKPGCRADSHTAESMSTGTRRSPPRGRGHSFTRKSPGDSAALASSSSLHSKSHATTSQLWALGQSLTQRQVHGVDRETGDYTVMSRINKAACECCHKSPFLTSLCRGKCPAQDAHQLGSVLDAASQCATQLPHLPTSGTVAGPQLCTVVLSREFSQGILPWGSLGTW